MPVPRKCRGTPPPAQEDTTADKTEGDTPDELLKEAAKKGSAAKVINETTIQEDVTTDDADDRNLEGTAV